MTSLERSWVSVALGLAMLMPGCDGEPGIDAGMLDGGQRDAVVDGGMRIPCDTDEDCDDGVSCTVDSCGTDGTCRNAVNAALCDDGVFCNGVERCDPRRGCQPPAVRETCNDDNVCTIDRCDEETRSCVRTPRDLDGDGDPDWNCDGGGDCDDFNANVSSLHNEVCGDGIDNDCDGMVDEVDCGRPRYDVCDDPLDVSAGGFFLLDTSGAGADHPLGCGGTGRRDLVARFTLTTERSVELLGEGDFFTVGLSLRSTCTSAASEIACHNGFPGRIQRRSLPAGTYYVVVASSAVGEIGLTVRFGPPLPPAPNDTCETPLDVSAGGTFTESFAEVGDELTTSCGFGGAPDLVYTFTLEEERDVLISAQSMTGEALVWSVRSSCETGPDLRCVYGGPASGRVYGLAPGTYFIVVEGPTYVAPVLRLSVELLEPSSPPPGDTCLDPIPLELGRSFIGTLVDKQDDLDVSCGFRYRDAVHQFTIDTASDVTVTMQGAGGASANVSVRPVCAESSSEVRCASGSPARAVLRDLAAGTYFVIAESWRAGGYTVQVDAAPPTTVVDVSGNDTCATAHDLPPTGGLFRGNTTTHTNTVETELCGGSGNDAAFRLVLDARRRVVLSTEGSAFDTVLHVRTACSGRETYCDDDGGEGVTSLIDQVLDAGTWFVIVDGFGSSSRGEYLLDVRVMDP